MARGLQPVQRAPEQFGAGAQLLCGGAQFEQSDIGGVVGAPDQRADIALERAGGRGQVADVALRSASSVTRVSLRVASASWTSGPA